MYIFPSYKETILAKISSPTVAKSLLDFGRIERSTPYHFVYALCNLLSYTECFPAKDRKTIRLILFRGMALYRYRYRNYSDDEFFRSNITYLNDFNDLQSGVNKITQIYGITPFSTYALRLYNYFLDHRIAGSDPKDHHFYYETVIECIYRYLRDDVEIYSGIVNTFSKIYTELKEDVEPIYLESSDSWVYTPYTDMINSYTSFCQSTSFRQRFPVIKEADYLITALKDALTTTLPKHTRLMTLPDKDTKDIGDQVNVLAELRGANPDGITYMVQSITALDELVQSGPLKSLVTTYLDLLCLIKREKDVHRAVYFPIDHPAWDKLYTTVQSYYIDHILARISEAMCTDTEIKYAVQ